MKCVHGHHQKKYEAHLYYCYDLIAYSMSAGRLCQAHLAVNLIRPFQTIIYIFCKLPDFLLVLLSVVLIELTPI
jgi:hypothetical protein